MNNNFGAGYKGKGERGIRKLGNMKFVGLLEVDIQVFQF